jgi:hypothetical protein
VPAGFQPPPGPAERGAETERSQGSSVAAFLRGVVVPPLVATLVGFTFVVVFLDAFHSPVPHHLPVGVVGAPQDVQRVRTSLQQAQPGGFAVHRVADATTAQTAVLRHDLYGVYLPGPPPKLVEAGANSQGVTMTLAQAFMPIAQQGGGQLQMQDLRPLVPGDTRGLGIFYGAFGVVLGGFLFGLLSYQAAPKLLLRWRLLSIVLFAVASGAVTALAADVLYAAVPAGFGVVFALVAMLALSVAATSAFVLRVVGSAATFLLSVSLITLGNATSTGNLPEEYLPPWMQPFSAILPPGVAVRALRGATYFDGDGIARAFVVLSIWSAVPLLLIGLVDLVSRRRRAH